MTSAVHKHGALAGCELFHGGLAGTNRMSRERAMGPSAGVVGGMPTQVRAMSRDDIREVRRWHRAAALRARDAGFDIVYVYASHTLGIAADFLSRRVNRRNDEYGGELTNRVRLLRELIEDTKDAIGDRCAVAVRFGVDEVLGDEGYTCRDEGRRVVEMLADLPDLWDVNVNNLAFDMMTSRFTDEGYQETFVDFVKQVTRKPVVGVGRFTSPDTMVSMIKRGILDLIGAARPSIADPFLPRKIESGHSEDIRECIGCNVCLSMQAVGGPIRCTQNPTTGEEWRRGWHPETIPPYRTPKRVLVVGAGPAGLEAARALGGRGYEVALAEASTELGGRILHESSLPGLRKWIRVRDYRVQQLERMNNVTIFPENPMSATDVIEAGYQNVVIAAGSRWRRDGVAHANHRPISIAQDAVVITPDDVFAGVSVTGPVVIYDDEHYYMGGALAEKFRREGHSVTLVTPGHEVSTFLRNTVEFETVQRRLLDLGVTIVTARRLTAIRASSVDIACIYTAATTVIEAKSLVLVCMRDANDSLYKDLLPRMGELGSDTTLCAVGDCDAPGTIAEAIFSGHRFAREFEESPMPDVQFYIERPVLRGSV
jgi:dimethylamine/trimethylamine dehydrogenase